MSWNGCPPPTLGGFLFGSALKHKRSSLKKAKHVVLFNSGEEKQRANTCQTWWMVQFLGTSSQGKKRTHLLPALHKPDHHKVDIDPWKRTPIEPATLLSNTSCGHWLEIGSNPACSIRKHVVDVGELLASNVFSHSTTN